MTGIFLRVLRDGMWSPVLLEDLTDAELNTLEHERPLEGWMWMRRLLYCFRENASRTEPIRADTIEAATEPKWYTYLGQFHAKEESSQGQDSPQDHAQPDRRDG